jgi:hypothetical protein
MARSNPTSGGSLVILLAFLFLGRLTQDLVAQGSKSPPPMTNCIPPNLFLTEAGIRPLFWYTRSGERLVEIRTIEAARGSKESRPASEDPEGHWGQATNGFQLSLRFEKEVYTNGEPVLATMLVRNVSNVQLQYLFPARVAATKDGSRLKRKDDIGVARRGPARLLYPQTQARDQENLNQVYDLTPGEYKFWAACDKWLPSSGTVKVKIRN